MFTSVENTGNAGLHSTLLAKLVCRYAGPSLVFAGGCERIGQRRHLFVAAIVPVGTAIEAEQELRLRDR